MDLNLLTALDALLAERSVTDAAKRLGLSVSATSRTLTRLRAATGDPLLVQAGRALVPTPHAEQLDARGSRPCNRRDRPGLAGAHVYDPRQ
jgi:DNA-binding transcriptional LysR family regulator